MCVKAPLQSFIYIYTAERIRQQPRWRENDWYFPGVRGPVPSAGTAHEGTRIGSRNICQGARVTMPNTSAGVGITFASGPLVPGWHMPSGQKSEKVSKKMATRQMPGASPHGTLLADDPWSSTERSQGRPSLPGEGVERPYGNYGKPVESSRRECRDGEGEVV